MKTKYIGAVFFYFVTFTISVMIVGLPAPQSRFSTVTPAVDRPLVIFKSEIDLQTRINNFLEDDLQTGIELENDEARLSQSRGLSKAEKLATLNLVEKMKKVKCDKLPEDFCQAWDEHRNAWTKKAEFLNSGSKTIQGEEAYRNQLSIEISRTYLNMLAAARRHEVEFRY
ncbi:MAG TPA: hypothetical protein VIL74_16720 [Pyrinomonadaceae bacterium]|jgi:hypothetical protein